MDNKRMLLLSTLFLSTSKRNYAKYCKDKKLKKKAKGEKAGMILICFLIFLYIGFMGLGVGIAGGAAALPGTAMLLVWILSFFLTIFKTNGYLFNFKEYDMLMAMPFPVKTIVADKFLYMYINSLPYYLTASLSLTINYAIFGNATVLGMVFFVLLSLFAPLLPMVLATAFGALAAKLSSGFKYKKIVQAVLIIIIVTPMFFTRFLVEKYFRDGEAFTDSINSFSAYIDKMGKWLIPLKWFDEAVNGPVISSFLLYVGVSILVFELFFALIARSYRQINSALSRTVGHTKAKAKETRKKSMVRSISFKEMKRFFGSTTYMTNVGIGQGMAVLVGIVALFVPAEKLVGAVMNGAPITAKMLVPSIPFITFFFIGMVASTCCSLSLEGKNYWIIQSLPISKLDVYKGKMLFNLWLTIPFQVFADVCLCISAKANVVTALLTVLLSIAMCLFCTTFGMVRGIKYADFDWENEIEIIKQGKAVAFYILPNIFATMIFMAGIVYLGTIMNVNLVLIIFTGCYLIVAGISYLRVLTYSKKKEI